VKILSITAGAAGMYCGSCARDNALAVELLARGHDVTLVPIYTPTNPDEANVSRARVLFGGISIYLQQYVPLFRRTPRFVDRILDSPAVIRAFAGRSISTDPKMLGELMMAMLDGDGGVLRKEFDKLSEWLASEPVPDVVNIPNSLLISLARPIRERLRRPVVCTLQGEDLFLDGLVEPYRSRAIESIRRQAREVDRFIAVSEYYVEPMARLLAVDATQIAVVPLGINLAGYVPRAAAADAWPFTVGYFARIAPEKGLHVLAQAYVELRRMTAGSPMRFEAAGYLAPAQQGYFDEVTRTLAAAGLAGEFTYRGAVDRDGKLAFLRTLDALSVPTPYDEPKGVFVLEALASGVPVVQPRRGAFTEMIERTGGGLLVAPDDPSALAKGLHVLWQDRGRARELGRRGADAVRTQYSIQRSADRLLEVYDAVVSGAQRAKTA